MQLGFVDFGTALLRRQDCIEEVRLNRRLAPDLYLGVRDIHGPADQARFHGPGVVIEAAVQMRQFGQGALLPLVLQRQELADFLHSVQSPGCDGCPGPPLRCSPGDSGLPRQPFVSPSSLASKAEPGWRPL